MTDTFPFPAGEADDEGPRPAGRRLVLLAAGGLGVAALAAVGVLALSGPADEDLGLGLPTGAPAAAATPEASATGTAPSPTAPAPAAVSALQRGRDPFRGPAGGTSGTAGAPGTAAAPAAGEGAAAPAPGARPPEAPLPQPADVGALPVDVPAPPPAGGGLGGEQDGRLRQVSLVRVTADQTAVLSVDGTSQTVRVGDDFGPGGVLLLLSLQEGPEDGQWTAVVQRGSGDPFDVVTGQPANVA